MQILTDANIIGKAAHINVGDAFLLQLRTQRGVREFFIIPEHRIRVDFGICSFVNFEPTVDDLAAAIIASG